MKEFTEGMERADNSQIVYCVNDSINKYSS